MANARFTIQIRTCGILVDRGQVGILMNDLDCGDAWGTCWACPGRDRDARHLLGHRTAAGIL